MVGSSDDAKALTTDIVAPDAVEAFLERNPSFLNDRPALLQKLVPPQFDHGSGVVDMQMFMLDRLRDQLKRTNKREKSLLEAVEANSRIQRKVYRAVDALLAAQSVEELIRCIVDDLPSQFDVTKVALCIETDKPLPEDAEKAGLMVLAPGTINSFGDVHKLVLLLANTRGHKAIFGGSAGNIRSMAHLRLEFGAKAPRGLLALGSTEPEAFDPNQSTDLLAFFAQVLERCVRRWLNGDL
jgi:uncharacterized protein YigA (DUF484 family)